MTERLRSCHRVEETGKMGQLSTDLEQLLYWRKKKKALMDITVLIDNV